MRASRAWPIALLLAATTIPAATGANAITGSFTACVMLEKGGECVQSTNVLYGSTVWLKGKVDPVPDGRAKLLKKAPGSDTWELLALADISDKGVMTHRWVTGLEDADQVEPNLLKFKVGGAGCSNKVELLVIAGE